MDCVYFQFVLYGVCTGFMVEPLYMGVDSPQKNMHENGKSKDLRQFPHSIILFEDLLNSFSM